MTNMYTFRQDEECKVCPSTGAQCINGIITNKPGFNSDLLLKFHTLRIGFWRSSILSTQFYQCLPNSESCQNTITDSICTSFYIGPLCQTCDKNFAKYNGKYCQKCYEKSYNIFLLILMALLFTANFGINIKFKILNIFSYIFFYFIG